ncbi:PH domain-containing protein [Streptomyces sp. NPDC090075]|uniref:PH domain-containing protein n=1 Tax=Streptomyces sp. NPDC090075 TaxID=3365937 RepID=UPI003821A228
MLVFLLVMFGATVSLPGGMLADDVSASVVLPIAVVWVTLGGWFCYALLRCSTAADIKAIHVRGMIRRRRLAWEDVQDIQAEATHAESPSPGVVVYVYGRDGRRVQLPFVDDLHVDVEWELAMLMTAWQELRGADWSPDLEAAVLIGQGQARRKALWAGVGATMLAFIPLTVLVVTSMVHPLVALGAVPLVFALTAITSYRRQLRNG